MTKNKIKRKDWVKTRSGHIGMVRYIGKLHGFGFKTSIWSEWENMWDGRLQPRSIGGQLSYVNITDVKKVTEKQKPGAMKKKYGFLFQKC